MAKTIVALATPPLKGALAVIRLSGDDCFEYTDRLFSKKVSGITRRESFVGTLCRDEEVIDQVVVLAYPNPHSMTGEDVVEVICHGSTLIAKEIISAYLSLGAEYATRGEFTSRAFYNGKMDLVEAEAVNDMINATTLEAKNLALNSLTGETSKLVYPLLDKLGEMLSIIETNIEYPDYIDIETPDYDTLIASSESLIHDIDSLIKEGNEGKIVKDGVKVALIGKPNVGKSSLLNCLLKEDKAIVSDTPGTTRDIVEGEIVLSGIPLKLLDTAGIRESDDFVERLGIEKSNKAIEEADLVLHLIDDEEEVEPNEKTIPVYTKSDIRDHKVPGRVYISSSNGDIEELKKAILDKVSVSPDAFKKPSLCNARQLGLLMGVKEDLLMAVGACKEELPIDLVSVHVQSAYNKTRRLLGKDPTQDFGDEIFSRFCVGK